MNSAEAEAAGDLERRRLIWRCRRGMKELDVLLERYTRHVNGSMSIAEGRALAALLELADPQLADYLFGHAVPNDPELAVLARRIGCGAFATGEGA
jgi:antitoxin CptB